MVVLGIETSCDETAAAVVVDGARVLSSVVASQHDLHAEYGGVVPEIASRAHAERIGPVVVAACAEAGIGLGDVDGVAVGHKPGLIGSLLVGVSAAKALAWSLGVPIVGVDHVRAHLHAGVLDAGGSLEATRFPALGLVVSGGHSSIYAMRGPMEMDRLGATIDDAVGEAFDKAAAVLGLGHPGGPAIDRLAAEDGADDRAHAFPVSKLGRESLDFSFSGLKTALLYAARGVPGQKDDAGDVIPLRDAAGLDHAAKRDLAASFQRAACAAVVLKLERALERVRADGACETLLVGGGVTANSRLRRELLAFGDAHGLAVRLPAMDYCVDNAAWIAGLGGVMLAAGVRDDLALTAEPTS